LEQANKAAALFEKKPGFEHLEKLGEFCLKYEIRSHRHEVKGLSGRVKALQRRLDFLEKQGDALRKALVKYKEDNDIED